MNFEISEFECTDKDGARIVFCKMQRDTAFLFACKVLARFGNWTGNTKTTLETTGSGLNDTWTLTLIVPPSKDPKHTPFRTTRGELQSFFGGIVDQFAHRDYKEKKEEFRRQVFP